VVAAKDDYFCSSDRTISAMIQTMKHFGSLLLFVLALGIGPITLVASQPAGASVASVSPLPLVRAHAHNDYAHERPLLDALECGFCSVEADVFLVEGQLLVAHNRIQTSPQRTLPALYLEPLRQRARQNGGRIYPGGPVCLLFIDLKTEAESTYAVLHRLLENYADLVTRFDSNRVFTNAVTVVITGNRPRATMAAQSTRYAACDGLLPDLESGVAAAFVPVISEQWSQYFKWRGQGPLPDGEAVRLKDIVAQAHEQGRRVRFWGAPRPAGGLASFIRRRRGFIEHRQSHRHAQFSIIEIGPIAHALRPLCRNPMAAVHGLEQLAAKFLSIKNHFA
jgi:hypothetical protein